MPTNNQIGVPLSGSTGTGAFVGFVSPSLTTPNIDAATGMSVTFSPSTSGITATATNDNASVGVVGQFISSVIPLASAVNLSNNTVANVTSITLPAGDWDVFGDVFFTITGTCTSITCWTSTSSATLKAPAQRNTYQKTLLGLNSCGIEVPFLRGNSNPGTTIFLSCRATFSTGTVTACGAIYARKPR